MSSDAFLTLNTSARMPLLGLGTWKSPKDSVGAAVEYALRETGYSHIDCAAAYGNEKEVGGAFTHVFGSGARKREDVFVTSKLWNSAHAKKEVRAACEQTLQDLQLDHLDLYLMHWGIATPSHWATPIKGQEAEYDENGVLVLEKISIQETWEAMEELIHAGLVKAIGVANFTAPMLIDVLSYAHIQPAMNQIELHPYFQQERLVAFCQQKEIAVTAYSPLGSPGNYAPADLLENELLTEIAKAHGKTAVQVMLRFAIQRNTAVIPKSIHPERIKENGSIFDFELSFTEMERLKGLDKGLRLVDPYQWGKIPYFD